MIERLFYGNLREELTKRGFFIATDFAPEHCVDICGINDTEKRVKYVEFLQKEYRFAAIKNFVFSVSNLCNTEETVGWYELLEGSRKEEPFPMIFIHLKFDGHYYHMAYECHHVRRFVQDNDGMEAVRCIIECVDFMTSSLMDVLKEWISEGKFPLHRFPDGAEEFTTYSERRIV